MFDEAERTPLYYYEPRDKTDNNDLTRIAKWLEQIYVTIDFPTTLFDPGPCKLDELQQVWS